MPQRKTQNHASQRHLLLFIFHLVAKQKPRLLRRVTRGFIVSLWRQTKCSKFNTCLPNWTNWAKEQHLQWRSGPHSTSTKTVFSKWFSSYCSKRDRIFVGSGLGYAKTYYFDFQIPHCTAMKNEGKMLMLVECWTVAIASYPVAW